MNLDVWAHSDPNLIAGVLNFIALMVHSTVFKSLLTIFALIGFLGAVINSMQAKFGIVINFLLGLALFMFIMMPSATVTVKSVSLPASSTRTVFSVPYIVAFPMSIFSTAGKWLGEQSEQAMYAVFASSALMPSSTRIYNQQSGPGLTLKTLEDYAKVLPPADLVQRMRVLFNTCIIPRAAVGNATGTLTDGSANDSVPFNSTLAYQDCTQAAPSVKPTPTSCLPYIPAKDLVNYVSPAMVVTDPGVATGAPGSNVACSDFYLTVYAALDTWSTKMSAKNASWLGVSPDKVLRETTGFLSKIAGLGPGGTATPMDAYGMRSLGKMLAESLIDYRGADVSNNALKTMFTQVANAETGKTFARVMIDYLPTITDVCLAIICAFFPLALLVMVMTAATMERIVSYFSVMLSIAFWPPMIAVINAIMNYYTFQLSDLAHAISAFGKLPPTAALGVVQIAAHAEGPVSAMGYMLTAVPIIAIGLVKGGEVAFTHAFQNLTRGAQQTAEQTSLDRFAADQKSFSQHSSPTRDLEGFLQYAKEHPGGLPGALHDLAQTSAVHKASEVGQAQGQVKASQYEHPGSTVTGAVQETSRDIAENTTGRAAGAAAATEVSGGGQISPAAHKAAYSRQRLEDGDATSQWAARVHRFLEDKGVDLEHASLDQMTHALFQAAEYEAHKRFGTAEAYQNVANSNGMTMGQLAKFLANVETQSQYGKAMSAASLAKKLGYGSVAEMTKAAQSGQLQKQLATSQGFDTLTNLFGGGDEGARKALNALGTMMGLDQGQQAFATEELREQAKKHGMKPMEYFRKMAQGEGAVQALQKLAQGYHGEHMKKIAGGDLDNLAKGLAALQTTDRAQAASLGQRLLQTLGDGHGGFDRNAVSEFAGHLSGEQLMGMVQKFAMMEQLGTSNEAIGKFATMLANEEAGRIKGRFEQYKQGGLSDGAALDKALQVAKAEAGGDTSKLVAAITAAGGGNFNNGVRQYARMLGIQSGSEAYKHLATAMAAANLSDGDKAILRDPNSTQDQINRILGKMENSMMALGVNQGEAEQVTQSIKSGILSTFHRITGKLTETDDPNQARDGTSAAQTVGSFAAGAAGTALAFIGHSSAKNLARGMLKKGKSVGGKLYSGIKSRKGQPSEGTPSVGESRPSNHGSSETHSDARTKENIDPLQQSVKGSQSESHGGGGNVSPRLTGEPSEMPEAKPTPPSNVSATPRPKGKRSTKAPVIGLTATAGAVVAGGAATANAGEAPDQQPGSPSDSQPAANRAAVRSHGRSSANHGASSPEDVGGSESDEGEQEEDSAFEDGVVRGTVAGATYHAATAAGRAVNGAAVAGRTISIPKSKAALAAKVVVSFAAGQGIISSETAKNITRKITDWTALPSTGNLAGDFALGVASLNPYVFAVETLAGLEHNSIEKVMNQVEKDGHLREFFDEDTSMSRRAEILKSAIGKVI